MTNDTPPEPTSGAQPRPRVRVLLVDDTAVLRNLLRRAFERTGRYEVVGEAADGAQAIRSASEHCPDLVMLDLQMSPGMSGFDALPVLAGMLPHARIVIFTGHDEEGILDELLAAGAATAIGKGTPMARVIEIIDALW